MANKSGPPGSPGNRGGSNKGSGGPNAGKGNNASLGAKGKAGERSKSRGKQRGVNTAYDGVSGGSGGPKKKSSSVMRESTWNNMSKGQRMKEYGTASYAKYKAAKKSTHITGTSRTNPKMRGK